MRWGCGCGSFRAGVRVTTLTSRRGSTAVLQALLVQSGERRNAENLSETVPGSPAAGVPGNPAGASGRDVGAPGSTAGGWGRWPTARRGCSWPMSARWDGHWWTRGCICPRVGPRTKTGVRRRVCRRIGRATGPRRSWPWRWWGGHRSGAT